MAAFDTSHLSIHNPQSRQQLPAEVGAAAGAAAAAAAPAVAVATAATAASAVAARHSDAAAAAAAAAVAPDSKRACHPPSRVAVKQDADGDAALVIILRDLQGSQTHFKVKQSTLMRQVFAAYAEKTGTELDGIRFVFDAHRLSGLETVGSLGLEDGDIINVYLMQFGD